MTARVINEVLMVVIGGLGLHTMDIVAIRGTEALKQFGQVSIDHVQRFLLLIDVII